MIATVKTKTTERMDTAIEHLKRELGSMRTGRASLALLDNVKVDCYGTPTPLKQVASLSVPDARLITVQPWDPKLTKEIERGIQSSELGLTPTNDGKLIRIAIPPLTEERRKDLIKLCKKHGEEVKVQLRNARRDGNEELKRLQKDAAITEDDLRRSEAEMQKLTDQYVQKVDQILKKKEEEILEI